MPGALTRWDPFGDRSELRNRFDRLFNELTDGRDRAGAPAIDVLREDGNLIVRADIPGTKPEDVKIEIEDDILTVSGSHEQHTEEQHKHYMRHERRCGSFSRSVALPAGVDVKQIKATTHHGVIEITIPLPAPASKETVTITPTAA